MTFRTASDVLLDLISLGVSLVIAPVPALTSQYLASLLGLPMPMDGTWMHLAVYTMLAGASLIGVGGMGLPVLLIVSSRCRRDR